jgi:hypothetical protein
VTGDACQQERLRGIDIVGRWEAGGCYATPRPVEIQKKEDERQNHRIDRTCSTFDPMWFGMSAHLGGMGANASAAARLARLGACPPTGASSCRPMTIATQ